MCSNDGKGNLEDGNLKGRRNSSQMIIHYGATLRVFNFITPEKAQVVLSAATAKKGTRAPSSENFMARELVNQTTQQNLLSAKLYAELPVARINSLQRFLEKRRQRLVKKAPYAVKNNTKRNFLGWQ